MSSEQKQQKKEGLLYQKIRMLVDSIDKPYPIPKEIEKHRGQHLRDATREVLDEAARDYPSLTELGMVPKLSAEDIEKIAIKRQVWFEKWFGSGGAEKKVPKRG